MAGVAGALRIAAGRRLDTHPPLVSMGAAEREKGVHGEEEAAALLRDLTGRDVRRRARQPKGADDLVGLPGWAPEVKRRKAAGRADIARWWAQAVSQAGEAWPVLLYRVDRCGWRAVWPLAALDGCTGTSQRKRAFETTADTTLIAWASFVLARSSAPDPLTLPPMANVPRACARRRCPPAAAPTAPRLSTLPHTSGASTI
jgi:hypothetical protein